MKEFKNVSTFLNCTEREDMVVFLRRPRASFASLLSVVLIVLNTDFTMLRLCLRSVFTSN